MRWKSPPDGRCQPDAENEVGNVAENLGAKAAGNQPISRHPLFPAIVALWFGALFGLVSLAIKPELLEQIVVASGIDSVIPMAAPPLGATMRILLALGMTGIGGVTGWLIAIRIALPQAEARERNGRRPRTANSGLALAAPHPENETARQSAREPAILNLSEFDLDSFDKRAAQPASTPVPAAALRQAGPAPDSDPLFDAFLQDIPGRPAEGVEAPEADQGSPIPALRVTARSRAAERIASADLDVLSKVELLERLALAMAQCRKPVAPAAAVARLEALDLSVIAPAQRDAGGEPQPEMETGFGAAQDLPEPEAALNEIASGPASWKEAHPAGATAPRPEGQNLHVPAALRPVGYDSRDNDDALPGYIPPRHIVLPPEDSRTAFAQPRPIALDEHDEAEEDVLDEGYSSLLDLSRSSLARPRLASAEEWEANSPPAPFQDATGAPGEGATADVELADGPRPFDSPAQPGPEGTEKALRTALASLQRMSGAA